ncbi:hypothetical protein AXF42_Ash019982 [Apostasia shenzhenica]|uniref:Small multi-drug export protein n=1 Tax=Apostasia shenzhenica TaxID=1088818 RepID=A0A2I0AZL0_9ASPA|nr:hypothetical protein AXF42_Ash019982 [Apostasia shenzhenica]
MIAAAAAATTVAAGSGFCGAPLPPCISLHIPSQGVSPFLFYPPSNLFHRLHTLPKSSLSSRPFSGDLHQKVRLPEIRPPEPPLALTALPPLGKRILLQILLCIPFSFICGSSFAAADDSIRASGFGLKVATALRKSGWGDEAIVFLLATLPVIELRGAIPVGYWMHLDPLKLTILSVLGNMVPVPFIVLYLKKFSGFLSKKSDSATKFLEILFEKAREKAGPVEEFQWLGLMLFVAVPFPGTGAWTGAIIATILDMPFWSAVSANFFGVVLAGLLVNLLVNLGLKHAIVMGIVLFFVSTFMWSILRSFRKTMFTK